MFRLTPEEKKILSLLPPIKRMRDYYLYEPGGKRRYTDFFQNGGRALLGHRPKNLSSRFKNTLSTGVYAEYPSLYRKKLLNILRCFFPDWAYFSVHPCKERALEVFSLPEPADPLFSADTGSFSLWRPFLSDESPEENSLPAILLPVIPVPGFCEAVVLAFRERPAGSDQEESRIGGDLLSPLAYVLLTQALTALRKRREAEKKSPPRPLFSEGLWEQTGPYLRMTKERIPQLQCSESYAEFFKAGLEKGILLPPSRRFPVILPENISDYDTKNFRKLTASFSW